MAKDGRFFMPTMTDSTPMPHDAWKRPSRNQATSWLRSPSSSSRTALFPDGRAAVPAQQQNP
eukprot:11164259-Heterocapsa_arctica.AAC.1